jgi:tetratricopeptide (TPR) repeat protein
MRYVLMVLIVFVSALVSAQTAQSPDQIRAQMAKIRQTTNWDDPVAAEKANAEIKKLASQLTGGKPPLSSPGNQQSQQGGIKSPALGVKASAVTKENIVAIAGRFYNRSYKTLDAVSKSQFDQDLKTAASDEFSLKAVKRLASTGGTLISMGDDHNQACVYITSAVKAMPTDTLSVNNFGAYLRIIDSINTSIPVLLYANKLYGQSPIILTQLGCSYFELDDMKQAELYLKEALKYDPDFGQAHTALCDLYIKQNRLQDAIIELFAGVKGMGFSYSKASGNFAYLQSQAENSPGGASEKEKFWEETRSRMNPPDALASLVPEVDRLKMPAFNSCPKVSDWMEGGGYSSAVQAYTGFHSQFMKFNEQFLQVHSEVPELPPNAVLRDYPNERFALDCITEYFFQASAEEANEFTLLADDIMKSVSEVVEAYLNYKERYGQEYVSCVEGCGGDSYCLEECFRKFCSKDCPASIQLNKDLQGYYEDYLNLFKTTVETQKKNLDDLYAFTGQWFSKIESPYWSRIYAYEIQRVALSVIGNGFTAHMQAFPFPAHSGCGTDCSLFANPAALPPDEVEEKEPKGNNCPQGKKLDIGLAMCSIAFDCESVEFGCAAGAAFSLKKNFINKSTTAFVGVGAEAGVGFAKASATAGFTMTRHANGDLDVGVKGEVTGRVGAVGKNYEGTVTVMEGPRGDSKDVIGIGL